LWEKTLHFSKTYYVDGQAKNADDKGPGTKERPFPHHQPAAQVLQPGERVVIAEGVYRECIRPARGGTSPDAMISYEAAPGAKVVVKGAAVVKDWKPSEGWNFGMDPETHQPVKAWELHLDSALFPERLQPIRSGQRARQSHVAQVCAGQYVDLLPAARAGLCGRQAAGAGGDFPMELAGPRRGR
jgi:hypothetical protein